MKKQYLLLLLALFFGTPPSLFSQTNEGANFWFAFMEHRDINQNTMVVMITSKRNTIGEISIPLQGWNRDFSVQANQVTLITLPASAETRGSESVTNTGVNVRSAEPVSVYIHQYFSMRSEATVVLPEETLGRSYFAMSYFGVDRQEGSFPSEFIVVAKEDDTLVSIEVADDTRGGQSRGDRFNVRLDAGETYQVQGRTGADDLTGSFIGADKEIAVFSGARWTEVPRNCQFRDNLLEHMYPVEAYGKQFITVPNAAVNFDVFRILASENNTRIEVRGATTDEYFLDAGEFVEYQSSVSSYIVGDKPILVAQYNVGSACNGHILGDPSMVLLNSIEQTRDTVTLYNSSFQNISENYINIVALTAEIDFVQFDGAPLAQQNVQIFPITGNGDYSFARVRVNAGAHTIISEGCGVIATAYGYGNLESYAYSGGASFSKINANPIPEGGCLNDTIAFDTGLSPLRYTFDWDLGDGTTSTQARFNHIYDQLGAYTVRLILTDECLSTTDTLYRDLKVSLRQAVEADPELRICQGETLRLSATDLPEARYAWTGPNSYTSEEQFPRIPGARPMESGTYEVVGNVSGCKTFPAYTEVEVIPTPKPELGMDTILCLRNRALAYRLYPGPFARYEWSTGALNESLVVRREGDYSVRVFDEYGCTAQDSITIIEQCPTKIYVPNVFSPNDDGINDTFNVLGADIAGIHLQIFDRWGNLLFESTSGQAWNGRYRDEWVDPGVYVWVAVIEGFDEMAEPYTERLSGSVTLVR